MGTSPSFYLDNPVIRDLVNNPRFLNDIWNLFVPIYGTQIKAYSLERSYSFCSFWEYYGLKKLKIKNPDIVFPKFIGINNNRSVVESRISEIGPILNSLFWQGQTDYEFQLRSKASDIRNAISERTKRESFFTASHDLKNFFFKSMLDLLQDDQDTFFILGSSYLAWNWFCAISAEGLPSEFLREIQLGIWNQLREQGVLLPFGKIIDDFASKGELQKDKHVLMILEKRSGFDNGLSDMVDSEAITDVVLNGVVFVTYDAPSVISQRLSLALTVILEIEKALAISMPRSFGKVYCLQKAQSIQLIECLEPATVLLV